MSTTTPQQDTVEPAPHVQSPQDSIYGRQLSRPFQQLVLAGAALVALAAIVFFFNSGSIFDFGSILKTFDADEALPNLVGLVALTAVLYGAVMFTASRIVEGSRFAVNRLVTTIVSAFFALALIPLVSVALTVLLKGVDRFDVNFFNNSLRNINDLTQGGVLHAVYGSLIITALTTLISVPIGLMAAIYLVEYSEGGWLSRALTFFVDVMTGIPSIVAGLFAAALATQFVDVGYKAGIMGAIALSVLMIPIVVRSSEEMLRLVPRELREASYALGVTKMWTILKVVIPTSIAGIATGITLAIARVMGETAPLLVAVGTTDGINLNPFSDRMETLPMYAYTRYTTPGTDLEAGFDLAWAAALLLIIIVMVLNVLARLISKYFSPKGSQ